MMNVRYESKINNSYLTSFLCHFIENKLLLLQKKKKKKWEEQQKQLHYRNERCELHGKRASTKTLENKYLWPEARIRANRLRHPFYETQRFGGGGGGGGGDSGGGGGG